MRRIIKIILATSPVTLSILSAMISKWFLIIPWLPKDILYETNVAIYSGFLLGFLKLLEWIILPSSTIELEYTTQSGIYNNTIEVSCPFIDDVATIYLKITLSGKPKIFKNRKIKLVMPPGVTAQKSNKTLVDYSVLNNREVVEINLYDVFNASRKNIIKKEGGEVIFQVIKSQESINGLISTELNNSSKIEFTKNEIRLTK